MWVWWLFPFQTSIYCSCLLLGWWFSFVVELLCIIQNSTFSTVFPSVHCSVYMRLKKMSDIMLSLECIFITVLHLRGATAAFAGWFFNHSSCLDTFSSTYTILSAEDKRCLLLLLYLMYPPVIKRHSVLLQVKARWRFRIQRKTPIKSQVAQAVLSTTTRTQSGRVSRDQISRSWEANTTAIRTTTRTSP